ncbi:MAG: ATP-binding cassette domain-containing protein [Thiolinea sp.]
MNGGRHINAGGEQLALQRGQWQQTYQLKVEPGEIITLQGRSGIGKSALLAAIAGFRAAAVR